MSQPDAPAMRTPWTERVGVRYPILQDGMGGGALGTARLAAAISNAGGLGSLSIPGGQSGPEIEAAMRDQIETALSLTDKPLAVNVPVGFDPDGKILPTTTQVLDVIVAARRADTAAERQIVLVTTSAGAPGDFSAMVRDAGLLHEHKVGAPAHARKAVEAGADFVIASGWEMGAHTHAVPMTTTILAPAVLDEVEVPVLVSGGIKDGRGLAAMLAMGAAGVAMGTRFLVSAENDWHDNYIQRIQNATVADSIVVPGVYGPCRYLRSKATDDLLEIVRRGELTGDALTDWKNHRSHIAQRDGDVAEGFTAAGMVGGLITDRPTVSEIIQSMVRQASELLGRVPSTAPAGVSS